MALPTSLLFNRFAQITIGANTGYQTGASQSVSQQGGVQITYIGGMTGLDLWFQIKRSLKPKEPSTCDLKIWNLADSTRQAINAFTNTGFQAGGAPPGSKTGGLSTTIVPVKIVAGYVGNISTVFLGNMRSAQTVQDNTDLVTELNTGDSDESTILARSSRSFPPGANAYNVALSIIQNDMGCGIGNIASVQAILAASPLFKSGAIVKGNSMEHLSDIATACGLEVSVQGGATQWVTAGRPLGGQAYLLSSGDTATSSVNTGLTGSPTVDTKGVLHAECLLLPGLAPGQPIQIDAKFVQGWFRILSLELKGDTKGTDWGFSIEAGRMQIGPNQPWLGVAP
jgi:hypothetical protein